MDILNLQEPTDIHELFGVIPEPVKFDESIYNVDLSAFISSGV